MRAASYYMLSFSSTHYALQAERCLAPLVPVCAMPTLRAVSQSCGISLRVEEADQAALKAALLNGFPIERGLYSLYRVRGGAPEPAAPEALADA